MGRQPLGAAAKNNTASVRLTDEEKKELARRFGTPTRALRTFVDTVMAARTKDSE